MTLTHTLATHTLATHTLATGGYGRGGAALLREPKARLRALEEARGPDVYGIAGAGAAHHAQRRQGV